MAFPHVQWALNPLLIIIMIIIIIIIMIIIIIICIAPFLCNNQDVIGI